MHSRCIPLYYIILMVNGEQDSSSLAKRVSLSFVVFHFEYDSKVIDTYTGHDRLKRLFV